MTPILAPKIAYFSTILRLKVFIIINCLIKSGKTKFSIETLKLVSFLVYGAKKLADKCKNCSISSFITHKAIKPPGGWPPTPA